MLLDNDHDGTSEELTAETAATAFEQFLSDDEETEQPETPPTQEQSPASAADTATEETESKPVEAEEAQSTESDEETEESEEAPDDDGVDLNAKYRVKVNGEEVEATLDEILKGYSRTADYTRKTQELAEQRKQFEAEFGGVREERQQYAHRLAQLEQAINDATPQEPDWDKVQQETPDQFPMLRAQWSLHNERMQALREERLKAEHAVMQDRQAERQQYLAAQREKVLEVLPEWKDEAKAKEAKAKMVAYVKDMGYTVDEISRVEDYRLIALIDKAMRWDAAQKKKPDLTKRIERIKVATPGPSSRSKTRKTSKAAQARQRLAKDGTRDAFASVMMDMLD